MKLTDGPIMGRLLVACLFGMAWFPVVDWAQNPPRPQSAIGGVIAAGAVVGLVKGGLSRA